MSESIVNDSQTPSEADGAEDDEAEPKLKYVRLENELKFILLKSNANCIAVHPKFICLGSQWGVVYLLDHDGYTIKDQSVDESSSRTVNGVEKTVCKELKLKSHTVGVNQISIDSNGEYLATCSDDGMIFIHSLFSKENSLDLNVGRLVKTIALDPMYSKSGANRRFILGDDKLTLYERTFLGGIRPTVLCNSEGFVRSLCWGGQYLAWASNIGVRVYDLNARCSLGLIKWETNAGLSIEKYRCNLRWADSRTLLIGWVDTVRVCVIRKKSTMELAKRNIPDCIVDPVSTFRTDFYISGIAPLEHQLVILGCPKKLTENQKAQRPQLYIVEYRDNDSSEICTDILYLRGYEECTVNDYHLDVLSEENRFFIVAPKDVVIASTYDLDDRIQWFIKHRKFEDALDTVMRNDGRNIQRYTAQSVGIYYLDFLLSNKEFDQAAKLCLKICGKNPNLWEDQILKFAGVHQLRSISPYIPRTLESKLDPQIYELILLEFLNLNAQGFLNLVKEWNPGLYNTSTVIKAVEKPLLKNEKNENVFLEALAILYSYEQKYDKSLSVYLKLKHKDVFTLIEKHELYGVIENMLGDLMDLDYKKTIALILDKNTHSIDNIVKKLQNNQLHLYRFLDEFNKKNPKGEYHRELVTLYAIFDREKLLPFLKKSDHYPIQEALDICKKQKFYREMVYLLGYIGDTKEALQLIVEQLKDMQYAISFCQENNDAELWDDLITRSMDNPESITFLLQHVGTSIDPTILIDKIKNGTEIPGLKNSLVKMLQHYNLQVSVQEGCKKILVSDYFNLQYKLVNTQQRGISINDETLCGACHKKVVQRDDTKTNNLIIFNCKHAFHRTCVGGMAKCGICYPLDEKDNYRRKLPPNGPS